MVRAALQRLNMRARALAERAFRELIPGRMAVVPFSWPLLPGLCPCDLDFCDYLRARDVRGKSVFHFGPGGHHTVGLRNQADALGNDIMAITASPAEHVRYVRLIVRSAALGAHYKVLFADIYDLTSGSMPRFDVVSLFHLCEYSPVPGDRRRLDDIGVLSLFLNQANRDARVLFYAGSFGWEQARAIVERAERSGALAFDESFGSLRVYRVTSPA